MHGNKGWNATLWLSADDLTLYMVCSGWWRFIYTQNYYGHVVSFIISVVYPIFPFHICYRTTMTFSGFNGLVTNDATFQCRVGGVKAHTTMRFTISSKKDEHLRVWWIFCQRLKIKQQFIFSAQNQSKKM